MSPSRRLPTLLSSALLLACTLSASAQAPTPPAAPSRSMSAILEASKPSDWRALDPARTLYALQNEAAVQAGAFHNDVVAVANANVLLAHPLAFADPARLYRELRARLPNLHVVETFGVSLEDAVSSYLFNSQLVSLPGGGMALILPSDAQENPAAWAAVEAVLAGDNPIERAVVVDVRESMRNGGGPACLRLRVPVDGPGLAGIDPGFILDEARWTSLAKVVVSHWPEQIAPGDLVKPDLWAQAREAHAALEAAIG